MGDETLEIHRSGGAGAGGGDATEAKQDVIIAEVTNLDGDAMRGTDNAAPAATALSSATWTNAMAALIEAMRGTDNAALAATALSDAVWTGAKAAFLDADITSRAPSATALTDAMWTDAKAGALADWINGGRLDNLLDAIPTTAMRGTNSAALAATALSDVTWTDAKAAFLTQAVTVGIKKGVARTIVYKMVDATDFATEETGVDVTETISKDGGAFAACTNADSEIGNGWYKILLTDTEMNASEIIYKGTGAGCAQCDRLIVTEA